MRGKKAKKAKKVISMALVCLMVSSNIGLAQGKDYENHWAENSIQSWVDKGYVKGYADGSFKPEGDITRAEFISIVNRSFGFTEQAEVNYKDVKPSHWAYGEFKRASAAKYIGGFEDGTLRPNSKITRQEVAAIMSRLLNLPDAQMSEKFLSLKDVSQIPQWSAGPVSAVVDKGYMNLRNDSFKGALPATRAEVISALDKSYMNAIAIKYDKPGTYTAGVVNGNVEISAKGVILENTTINGNLIISEGVESGEVTLKNVTIKGDTIVKGGGMNTITLQDSFLRNLIVNKKDGKVRILAKGSTDVSSVDLQSGAKLESSDKTANNFGDLVVSPNLAASAPIILAANFRNVTVQSANNAIQVQRGIIKNLEIAKTAKDALINLAEGVKVDRVEVNAPTKIDGKGKIETAAVNVSGSVITAPVTNVEKSEGVEVKTETPSTPSGGGGGGGGGGSTTPAEVAVSAISVTGNLVVGETLTAVTTPAEATVTYQWQKADAVDGTYTDIAGATNKTYVLVAEDAGKYIKVKVTGTSGNYTGTPVSVASGKILTVEEAGQVADNADIAAAKKAIEDATYTATQAEVVDLDAAKIKALALVNALGEGLKGTTVELIHGDFTAAVAGDATTPDGTPGSFNFTVKISKGTGTEVATDSKVMTITATPYVAPVTLESIAIKTPATKLVYTVGDELDITGLVIEGTYSDESKKDETITAANVTGFDSTSAVASQTLTVTVDGKTTTYTVEIKAAPSATVSNVTVSGKVGVYTSNNVLTITLLNDSFKEQIGDVVDVGTWFTDKPSGDYTIRTKGVTSANATTITIDVALTPSEVSSAVMQITIPGDRLNSGKDLTVTTNSEAKFAIAPALINAVAPVITTDLTDKTTTVGSTVTLDASATVTDGGTVSYAWYSATAADKTGAAVIADQTNATYAPAVDAAGTFYYYAVVTNTNNSATGTKTAETTSAVATVTVEAPTYAVTLGDITRVDGDTESTISINPISAKAGETVYLTVSPKVGMQLKAGTLKAKYNDGTEKEVEIVGSAPYSFTMPAFAVVVTAEFEISDASLLSVASKTDAAPTGGFGGSASDPIRWSINVANEKVTLASSDIEVSTDATFIMYSDNSFSTVITEQALTAGGSNIVYIKVTSQSGLNATYYAITITRSN